MALVYFATLLSASCILCFVLGTTCKALFTKQCPSLGLLQYFKQMHLLTILSSPTSHSMADSAKSKNRAYIVLEVPACGGFRKGDTCDKWLKVRAVAITTKSDLRIELKVVLFFKLRAHMHMGCVLLYH